MLYVIQLFEVVFHFVDYLANAMLTSIIKHIYKASLSIEFVVGIFVFSSSNDKLSQYLITGRTADITIDHT